MKNKQKNAFAIEKTNVLEKKNVVVFVLPNCVYVCVCVCVVVVVVKSNCNRRLN